MKKEINIDGKLYRLVEDEEQKKENPYGLYWDESDSISLRNVTFKEDSKRAQVQEAFNTLLELMSCEGVEEKVDNKDQYIISYTGLIHKLYYEVDKRDNISPAFDIKENAQKAIEKVGEDRLMEMFNVLGGKFDDR